MKRPRSYIVMMVDAKRHKRTEPASVNCNPNNITDKPAPQQRQSATDNHIGSTSTEGGPIFLVAYLLDPAAI